MVERSTNYATFSFSVILQAIFSVFRIGSLLGNQTNFKQIAGLKILFYVNSIVNDIHASSTYEAGVISVFDNKNV